MIKLDETIKNLSETYHEMIEVGQHEEELMEAFACVCLENKRTVFIHNDCFACGGNWSAMLLSGIKNRWREFYESMPDRSYSFIELTNIVDEQLLLEAVRDYAR